MSSRLLMKRDYAKHRGCSPAYVSKLLRLGRLAAPAVDAETGMIDVDLADAMLDGAPGDVAAEQHEATQGRDDRGSKATGYTAARTREIQAKAELAEMEAARRRGELLRRDVVAASAQALFERVVASVLKVPQSISLDLVPMTDPAAIEDRLTAALKTAIAGQHEEFLKDAERRSAA